MIESVNVKNSNARLSTTHYIDDITSFANIIILELLFKFESFSEKKNGTKTKEKNLKKKEESFEKITEKRVDK